MAFLSQEEGTGLLAPHHTARPEEADVRYAALVAVAAILITLIATSLASAVLADGPSTYTTQHLYDNYGALIKTIYPDGTVVEYKRNALGKITEITRDGAPVVTNISYAPPGAVQETDYANGIRSTNTYDPDQLYRLTSKRTTLETEVLQDISYTYDPVGNITRIADTGTGAPKEATYTYDDLDRLEQAVIQADEETTTESYTYSPTGNILFKSDVGEYQYADPQHPHAVTRAGSITFEYDPIGNLIRKVEDTGNTDYQYDYQNRLTTVTNPSGTSTYKYGEDRQRVQKLLPHGSAITYLDELAEVDEAGAFTNYIFADDERVATADAAGLYYKVGDHLSSASLEVDESGAVVQKLDYLPFGKERVNGKIGPFETRFTFTDQENDSESSLLYYGARYYSWEVARFTQPDPVALLIGDNPGFEHRANRTLESYIKNPQNLNLHSYVANNPLKYADPSGEAIDVFADVFFISMDVGTIVGDVLINRGRNLNTHLAALEADLVATALPGVTGAGLAVRSGKAFDRLAKDGAKNLAPHEIGRIGEERLEKIVGDGTVHGYHKTQLGKRFPDRETAFNTHEAKNTRISASGDILLQAKKDQFIKRVEGKQPIWHLFKGGTENAINALRQMGIEVIDYTKGKSKYDR